MRTRFGTLLLAPAALLGCAAGARDERLDALEKRIAALEARSGGSTAPPSSWPALEAAWGAVHHAPGFERDAEKIRGMIDAAWNALKVELAAFEPEARLRKVHLSVYVHARKHEHADVGLATLIYPTAREPKSRGELHYLAPSRHPDSPGQTTGLGEPFNDDYHRRILAHECSTVLLDLATEGKKRGWKFFEAPGWFVQGYEEYLGLTCGGEHSCTVTRDLYVKKVARNPGRVRLQTSGGRETIDVDDPYTDGTVLLLFMHDAFGRAKVQAVLARPEASFYEALTAALGVPLSEFHARWKDWISGG